MARLKYFLLVLLFSPWSYGQSLKTPNISANALFLYQNSDFAKEDTSTQRNGMDIQEAELAFYADVDPYSRLTMLLSIHPDYELVSGKVVESWQMEPEELYSELTQIPGINVKIGKFYAAFGKHNLLHTHAYPFVDAPLANTALLGDEGLNDVGVSVAGLLPTNWFSEVTLQYLRGEGDNAEFDSPTPGDGVGLAHWKNLMDLSEDLTFEVGVSYAAGTNSLAQQTALDGADLTFKWRPADGGRYHSWIFGTEYIERHVGQPGTQDEKGQGTTVWGQYQFAERWAGLLRYENLKVQNAANANVNPNALPNDTTNKYCASLVFNASEFSSYRLEYDFTHGPENAQGLSNDHKLYVQANFTIGSHPAHAY